MGVALGTGVLVAVGVAVTVGVDVAVALGIDVRVAVGVAVAPGIGVFVDVGVDVAVAPGIGVTVTVGVGPPSLSAMVTMLCPSARVALTAPARLTTKLCADSGTPSSLIGTLTVTDVCPARMTALPFVAS
jgi:hypothetical protein